MKVGDYVRTKNAYIDKIKDMVVEDYIRGEDEEEKPYYLFQLGREYYDEEFDDYSEWVFEDFIVKSSQDLIDLIEVGDYVNGGMVDLINDKYIGIENQEGYIIKKCFKIERIVTKEQFKSMEYKIGE